MRTIFGNVSFLINVRKKGNADFFISSHRERVMSNNEHRPDSAERSHYTLRKSKPLKFNTRVVYAGKLKRTPQWNESWHKHNFLEVIYVIAGAGKVELADEKYCVKAGDVVVYPPNTEHKEYTDSKTGMELAFFAVTGLKIPNLPANTLLQPEARPLISTGDDKGRFDWLFNAVLKEVQNSQVPYSEMMADFYVKILLTEILRKKGVEENSLVKNAAFSEIYEYIYEHYAEINSIEDICRALFITNYYVSHVFKKYTGVSPMQYVTKCRIAHAKKLLDETELTVREISTQCGYDETTNFFRNFKRSEGVTPTEYRQKSKVPDPAISDRTCQENSLYRA